jgi:hypothetical protein
MKNRTFGLVLLAALLLPWSGKAVAQEKTGPEVRFEEAEKLAASGRVGEAITIWEELLDTAPDALQVKVHARLGLAYRKFGKLPEAWHSLRLHVLRSATPEPQTKETLDQIEGVLKRTWSRVEIGSAPRGATLYFGEERLGQGYATPLSWWFKPGSYKLHLVLAGYEEATVTLRVPESAQPTVASFQLTKIVADGVLQIKGPEVGAQVFIDGLLEGTIPFQRKLKPGAYEIMVGRPGKPVWKKQITIGAGEVVVKRPRLPRDPDDDGSLMPSLTDADAVERLPGGVGIAKPVGPVQKGPAWWKWAVAGSGVALVAIGGALHSAAHNRNEELRQEYPDGDYWHRVPADYPVKYKEGYDNEVVPMASAAYALYGLGAATAVTGVVLLLIPEDRKPAGTVAPTVNADGGGISFTLEF